MDDDRVEMHHLDALRWFRDRFSDEARLDGNKLYGTEERFDVVILDALDPQNAVDFVEALYGDGSFLNSLYNSLNENGVLLTQVGEALVLGDISETYPGNFNYQRSRYEEGLKNQGFEAIMPYNEPRAGFSGTWSFYAAFKDVSSRSRWLMNEAQIDLEIRKRSIRMVDDVNIEDGEMNNPFEVFDGPTMVTYRYPSKESQVVYCLRDPQPYGCVTNVNDHIAGRTRYEPSGFDPEIPNFTADNFVVENNTVLVPRVTIPENSYMMLEQSVHEVRIPPATSFILNRMKNTDNILNRMIDPVYTFVAENRGASAIVRRGDVHSAYSIDIGLLSFLKHGYNQNPDTNSSVIDPDTVQSSGGDNDLIVGKSKFKSLYMKELVFNPSHTRNLPIPELVVSSHTIEKGKEIYSNFVPWYDRTGWKRRIMPLRSQYRVE